VDELNSFTDMWTSDAGKLWVRDEFDETWKCMEDYEKILKLEAEKIAKQEKLNKMRQEIGQAHADKGKETQGQADNMETEG